MNPRGKPRYIYFMRPVGVHDRIKIGCSYNPVSRLLTFARWSPYELEVFSVGKGNLTDEKTLHDYFAADRLHHEWFVKSPALMTVIDLMAHGASADEAIAALSQRKAA